MKRLLDFLKATVLGGVVFLVPVIAVIYVVGKALVLSRRLADPVVAYLPVGTVVGIAIVDIVAIVLIMLICFVAGLVARNSMASAVVHEAESRFLWKLPGYGIVKGLSESFSEQSSTAMKPVVARFDDVAQIGFEIERLDDGRVVVYLPAAPDVWSGTVALMSPDRVDSLPGSVVDVVQSLRSLGHGTQTVINPPTAGVGAD